MTYTIFFKLKKIVYGYYLYEINDAYFFYIQQDQQQFHL